MNPNKPKSGKNGKGPLKISLKLSRSSDSIDQTMAPFSAPPSLKPPSQPIKLKLSLKRSFDSLSSDQPMVTKPEIPKIRIKPSQLPSPVTELAVTPPSKQPVPSVPKRVKVIYFYDLLTKLLELLKSKDVYGFFWEPVDTSLVLDYLEIIQIPMDFSTMEHKITQKEYKEISEFEQDFLRIVSNAKTYNAPDSVYYKTAERLSNFGTKAIHREAQKVADGDYELVFEPISKDRSKYASSRTASEEKGSPVQPPKPGGHALRTRESSRVSYAEDDAMEEFEELADSDLEQEFAKELQAKRANIALFKRAHDGSLQFTSLASFQPEFLTDGSLSLTPGQIKQLFITEYATDKHPIPALGDLLPKTGLSTATGLKREGPEYEWQCTPLNYGPYVNSFAPNWDSAKATLTPMQSMLLTLTYSDLQSKGYLDSLKQFANESELSFLTRYVEGLCNVLTKGTTAVYGIPLMEHLQNASIAAGALEHALTEEGKDIYPPLDDPNESKLYRISKQLLQLVRIQNQRLASDNPNHITEEEQQRADEIERNLTEACALVQPGDVVSEQALFDLHHEMQQTNIPQYLGTL